VSFNNNCATVRKRALGYRSSSWSSARFRFMATGSKSGENKAWRTSCFDGDNGAVNVAMHLWRASRSAGGASAATPSFCVSTDCACTPAASDGYHAR